MPSTSPLAYVLDTIVTMVEADTSMNVSRVWVRDTNQIGTIVYPMIDGVTYSYDNESGVGVGSGIASCELHVQSRVKKDTGNTGAATLEGFVIASKIKKIFDAFVPPATRNDDGVYYTRLQGMYMPLHTGIVDLGDGLIRMAFSITVHFYQERK